MKILIVGGEGFIGSSLAKYFRSLEGFKVRSLGRGWRDEYYSQFGPDVVVNCAGSMAGSPTLWDDNVRNTYRLLKLLDLSEKNTKFIQVGSSSEYGAVEGPRKEKHECFPGDEYSMSKLVATRMVIDYSADVSVARPFSVYGEGMSLRSMFGKFALSESVSRNFVCYEGSHDWIHVDDFCRGMKQLALCDSYYTVGEIFNFGTGVSTSNRDALNILSKYSKNPPEIVFSDSRINDYDVLDWRADISKSKKNLGWEPSVSLEEGLKKLSFAF